MGDKDLDATGEYDDTVKQMCWEWVWWAYKLGYGVEDMKPIDYRACRTRFNERWERQMERDG